MAAKYLANEVEQLDVTADRVAETPLETLGRAILRRFDAESNGRPSRRPRPSRACIGRIRSSMLGGKLGGEWTG